MIPHLKIYAQELKKTDKSIVISAIIGIVILELFALSKGINGILLTGVIATLAALAGLVLPTPKIMKR